MAVDKKIQRDQVNYNIYYVKRSSARRDVKAARVPQRVKSMVRNRAAGPELRKVVLPDDAVPECPLSLFWHGCSSGRGRTLNLCLLHSRFINQKT